MVGEKNEQLCSSGHSGARERALELVFTLELGWLRRETSDRARIDVVEMRNMRSGSNGKGEVGDE